MYSYFDLNEIAYIGCCQLSEAYNTPITYTNSVLNSQKMPVQWWRLQHLDQGCNYVLLGRCYHISGADNGWVCSDSGMTTRENRRNLERNLFQCHSAHNLFIKTERRNLSNTFLHVYISCQQNSDILEIVACGKAFICLAMSTRFPFSLLTGLVFERLRITYHMFTSCVLLEDVLNRTSCCRLRILVSYSENSGFESWLWNLLSW
jgi:hypothetical protein